MWKSGILLPTPYALDRQTTDGTSWPQFNVSTLSQKHPYVTPTYVECRYPTHQQIFYFQSRTAFYLPGSKANSMQAKHELHLCGEPPVSQDPWDQMKSFLLPSTPIIWVVKRYVTGIESLATHIGGLQSSTGTTVFGVFYASNEVRKTGQDTNSIQTQNGVHFHCTAKFSLLSTQRQETLYVPKKAGL